jgi:hypothetical protein
MSPANLLTRQLRAAEANSLHLIQNDLPCQPSDCLAYNLAEILSLYMEWLLTCPERSRREPQM